MRRVLNNFSQKLQGRLNFCCIMSSNLTATIIHLWEKWNQFFWYVFPVVKNNCLYGKAPLFQWQNPRLIFLKLAWDTSSILVWSIWSCLRSIWSHGVMVAHLFLTQEISVRFRMRPFFYFLEKQSKTSHGRGTAQGATSLLWFRWL